MIIIIKPKFRRDADRIRQGELLKALEAKIKQISAAESAEDIPGLKLLRGYSHHYRIIVKTRKYSYRVGCFIRGKKICSPAFFPEK